MSWKLQGQNKRNLKVNNLNAIGGYWNYKDSKFYHKNSKFLTTVGIGTSEPFSRLSFGDYEDYFIETGTSRQPILALNETKNGLNGVGIGYYLNSTKDTYGVKFMVGQGNLKIYENRENVKLYITNEGRFFFNTKPETSRTSATLDISGSISTNSSISIGNTNTLNQIGTLRFDKTDVLTSLKIKIKDTNNDKSDWYIVKLTAQGQSTAKWDSIPRTKLTGKQDNIYYNGKVAINYPATTTLYNTLSVKGNVVIANDDVIKKQYTYSTGNENDKEGYLILGKCMIINPPIKNYAPETENHKRIPTNVLLNLNINKEVGDVKIESKNFIFGGFGSTISENCKNNIVLGNKSSCLTANNYSVIYGNNCTLKNNEHSFVFGDINNVKSDTGGIKKNNIVFGRSNNVIDSEDCTIFGFNNNVRNDDSYFFGNNNQIYNQNLETINFVVGKNNNIKDFTTNITGKSAGYILGDSNIIESKTNDFANADCEAIILGDSNKCSINMDINQQSIILGNTNTSMFNSTIIGDNNTNNMRVTANEKIGENDHSTFIIGNNIDNTYPFTHAKWQTDNRLNLALNPATEKNKINKQPPLLLVVGQGKENAEKTILPFDDDAGTFSVDTSGNVRCSNIFMNDNANKKGLLRCEKVDTKKLLRNNKSIPFHEYIHQFEFRLWKTGNALLDNNYHIISIPYSGKLVKIISVLNLPNIQSTAVDATASVSAAQEIQYEIKNSGGTTKTITHPTQDYTTGVYPSSKIKEENITGFNIPNDLQNQSIKIKIVNYQEGWPIDEIHRNLLKVKITLVIDRSS
tara:strand:- start:2306 stop:4711 length:2406 start_codon:yes stop_codon:yes gene_type:complete